MEERELRRRIRRQLRSMVLEASLTEKKWADFNAPKGKVVDIAPSDFEDNDSDERDLVMGEAKEILDVQDVIASIMLVEDLRIQKN